LRHLPRKSCLPSFRDTSVGFVEQAFSSADNVGLTKQKIQP
jgi:hypothetical protein